jgi:hypothetical protein
LQIFGLDVHLPNSGRKGGAVAARRRGGKSPDLSYSEQVAPLNRRHKLGFSMVSTLGLDEERGGQLMGAIVSKDAFVAALQSYDLTFRPVTLETGLYFHNREAFAAHRAQAAREIGDLDYLLHFAVTHEPMSGTTNLLQDTLRPRLFNAEGQLVKRLEECYWSDQAIASELDTFVKSLADAIRMELRAIIRRQEGPRA